MKPRSLLDNKSKGGLGIDRAMTMLLNHRDAPTYNGSLWVQGSAHNLSQSHWLNTELDRH